MKRQIKPENCPGFQRLCQMIEANQVGVVLVSDLSRLSRSAADGAAFTRLCQTRDTLVAVDGRLVDKEAKPEGLR